MNKRSFPFVDRRYLPVSLIVAAGLVFLTLSVARADESVGEPFEVQAADISSDAGGTMPPDPGDGGPPDGGINYATEGAGGSAAAATVAALPPVETAPPAKKSGGCSAAPLGSAGGETLMACMTAIGAIIVGSRRKRV